MCEPSVQTTSPGLLESGQQTQTNKLWITDPVQTDHHGANLFTQMYVFAA